jgi:FkbM family methyltransferase
LATADKGKFRKAKKLGALIRSPLFRRALRIGVAAAIEHGAVAFRHDYATVIDVGAHHGQFALFVRGRFRRASIISFEPLPEAARVLKRTHALVGDASVVEAAVSSQAGPAEFVVSNATDSSSLKEILPSYVEAFPGTEKATVRVVSVVTLDDALESHRLRRPCLLKIDVQGAELDVLTGATRMLSAVDDVLIECSFIEFYEGQPLIGDVVSYLCSHGFVLADVSSLVRDRDRRCLQADLLFERSSR